jgi:hypothetical protein
VPTTAFGDAETTASGWTDLARRITLGGHAAAPSSLGQWSVVRVTGPYRYEPDPNLQNYGHIRPVRIEVAGLQGDDGMPELRRMRRYRGRMRRLTSEAEADLRQMVDAHRYAENHSAAGPVRAES